MVVAHPSRIKMVDVPSPESHHDVPHPIESLDHHEKWENPLGFNG